MSNKIIVNYSATEEKVYQLISAIEKDLTIDAVGQYKTILNQIQDSKGDAADKLRQQLIEEKGMIENLAGLLKEISQYIMDSAIEIRDLDQSISTHTLSD